MEGRYARLVFSNGELIRLAIAVVGCVMIGNGLTGLIGVGVDKVNDFVEKHREKEGREV